MAQAKVKSWIKRLHPGKENKTAPGSAPEALSENASGKAKNGRRVLNEKTLKTWGITFCIDQDKQPKESVRWLVDMLLDFRGIIPEQSIKSLDKAEQAELSDKSKLQDHWKFEVSSLCNFECHGTEARHARNVEAARELSSKMRSIEGQNISEQLFTAVYLERYVFYEWSMTYFDKYKNETDSVTRPSHSQLGSRHQIMGGMGDRFLNADNIRSAIPSKLETKPEKPLTRPTPDRWFAFPLQTIPRNSDTGVVVENSSDNASMPAAGAKEVNPPSKANPTSSFFEASELQTLEDLERWANPLISLREKNLEDRKLSSKLVCFPGVIVEVKKPEVKDTELKYLWYQISNATALCATMLKLWAGKRYIEHEMPVVGFTFHGPEVRVFITYAVDGKSEDMCFHSQCIWRGDLKLFRDAILFLRILDTTHFWMIHELRPWILGHLRWLRYKISNPEEVETTPKTASLVKKGKNIINNGLQKTDPGLGTVAMHTHTSRSDENSRPITISSRISSDSSRHSEGGSDHSEEDSERPKKNSEHPAEGNFTNSGITSGERVHQTMTASLDEEHRSSSYPKVLLSSQSSARSSRIPLHMERETDYSPGPAFGVDSKALGDASELSTQRRDISLDNPPIAPVQSKKVAPALLVKSASYSNIDSRNLKDQDDISAALFTGLRATSVKPIIGRNPEGDDESTKSQENNQTPSGLPIFGGSQMFTFEGLLPKNPHPSKAGVPTTSSFSANYSSSNSGPIFKFPYAREENVYKTNVQQSEASASTGSTLLGRSPLAGAKFNPTLPGGDQVSASPPTSSMPSSSSQTSPENQRNNLKEPEIGQDHSNRAFSRSEDRGGM